MTQEQKDLLLKDLCARLPYGVKVNEEIQGDFTLIGLTNERAFTTCEVEGCHNDFSIEQIKPYLFPLTSMTEEQCYEFYCRFVENDTYYNDFKEYYFDNGLWHKVLTSIDYCSEVIDWFNKNNIDYRGLIPMGLSNDATGLNIY